MLSTDICNDPLILNYFFYQHSCLAIWIDAKSILRHKRTMACVNVLRYVILLTMIALVNTSLINKELPHVHALTSGSSNVYVADALFLNARVHFVLRVPICHAVSCRHIKFS